VQGGAQVTSARAGISCDVQEDAIAAHAQCSRWCCVRRRSCSWCPMVHPACMLRFTASSHMFHQFGSDQAHSAKQMLLPQAARALPATPHVLVCACSCVWYVGQLRGPPFQAHSPASMLQHPQLHWRCSADVPHHTRVCAHALSMFLDSKTSLCESAGCTS